MQVGRWGDALVVPLPESVVEELALKEGDEVEVEVTGEGAVGVKRSMTREQALEMLQSMKVKLPPGYKFNRDELYED